MFPDQERARKFLSGRVPAHLAAGEDPTRPLIFETYGRATRCLKNRSAAVLWFMHPTLPVAESDEQEWQGHLGPRQARAEGTIPPGETRGGWPTVPKGAKTRLKSGSDGA